MNRKIYLPIFLFFYSALSIFATGSSTLYSDIRPISINDRAVILCHTLFSKNPSGGLFVPDVEYGFCISANDTILQFMTKVVSIDNLIEDSQLNDKAYQKFEQERKIIDSIFETDFNISETYRTNYPLQLKQFGFNKSNVQSFYKGDTLFVNDYLKQFGNKKTFIQKSLNNGVANEIVSSKIIRTYDFGDIIIFYNQEVGGCDGSEYDIGAYFKYENKISDYDVGYDCQHVNDVYFKKITNYNSII